MSRKHKKIRPFLKWPGNKFRLLDNIIAHLPAAERLIEPFVGSGAVFLNTHYDHYTLNDANADVILLFTELRHHGQAFIDYAKSYFVCKTNQPAAYYRLRDKFNCDSTLDPWQRAALFLYLNRHCYNGLCRYNQQGLFNVPFGRYNQPYFPAQEMRDFYHKSLTARFVQGDFLSVMTRVRRGSVVYCDPPYVPLTQTANFTHYVSSDFVLAQQKQLAEKAQLLSARGVPVVISNHDTPLTRDIYHSAHLDTFNVRRMISCKAKKRVEVKELIAIFKPIARESVS